MLLAWAGLFATYLVFAGSASADEIVAGGLCGGAAALWWIATRRVSDHTFTFKPGCWAAAGRACRHLPAATVSMAAVLLRSLTRPQRGQVAHRFFAHGRQSDPADGGRRAIGVLAASLAPDSIVLRTPAERDEIGIHCLPASEPPADPRWPI